MSLEGISRTAKKHAHESGLLAFRATRPSACRRETPGFIGRGLGTVLELVGVAQSPADPFDQQGPRSLGLDIGRNDPLAMDLDGSVPLWIVGRDDAVEHLASTWRREAGEGAGDATRDVRGLREAEWAAAREHELAITEHPTTA
jgi:hypothetical protein